MNVPQTPSRFLIAATAAYAPAWLALWFAWLSIRTLPSWLPAVGFSLALAVAAPWLVFAWKSRRTRPRLGLAIASVAYIFVWHWCVFMADLLDWPHLSRSSAQFGLAILFFIGLAWVVWGLERASERYQRRRRIATADGAGGELAASAGSSAASGAGVSTRPAMTSHASLADTPGATARVWNPLDPYAWYYGRSSRKLNQSLTALLGYTILFFLAVMLLNQTRGCQEVYELPAGGGQVKQLAQTVRIQKVIRKKFVVNPYSGIKFEVPPIDEVKLQLTEITEHAYTVGYGEGAGAGFAGGTSKGKVRLIRLEYAGGDWDLNFGVGADLNMLVEYGVRTQQKIADQTESRTIMDLKAFPAGKAPPVMFLTGQKSISVTTGEIKVLQQYLNEKHGMIFASNGGSGQFHQQFLALMNQVAPDVRPVPVPLDDAIHTIPYRLAAVPIVAPHGGRESLGWYKDGRWICYYHPGDISDAWCDDHAGVSAEVWEACYQLGVNVLFYAHAEHSKWMSAKQQTP
ncbi:MAG: DUF4159 domain-containing protein [Planctomycetota bacterium]